MKPMPKKNSAKRIKPMAPPAVEITNCTFNANATVQPEAIIALASAVESNANAIAEVARQMVAVNPVNGLVLKQ